MTRDIVVQAPTVEGPIVNRARVSATSPGDPNLANNVGEKLTNVTAPGTVDSEANAYVLPGGSLSATDPLTSSTFSIPATGDPVDTALSVSSVAEGGEQVSLLFGRPGNKDRNNPVKVLINWGPDRPCLFLKLCGTYIDPDNDGPQPLQVAIFCKGSFPGPTSGAGVVAPATNWRNGLPLLWCIDAQYRVGKDLYQLFVGVGDPKFLR